MQKIVLILFLSSIFIWAGSPAAQAQSIIYGRIINAETGEALLGANVFLSGTKMGTATDEKGYYQIDKIPAGGYTLVISIIGYERKSVNLVIGYGKTVEKNFELKPVVYELPKLYVGDFGEEWKENLERFTNHFIGVTGMADSLILLNPKVLSFDESWWGRLTAKAFAPLKIKNKALGYIITYYLKEFTHSGSLTRWDGEPFFTEMTPADSAQAAYWERNRRKAFYGSLRHFLLALIDNSANKEGFIIYNKRQSTFGYMPNNQDEISGDGIIEQGKKDFLFEMNFFGRLEIVYLREGEAPEYVQWLPNTYRAPREVQISHLDLNEHPVTVDINGEIILPYAATQYGYFSFQRLAYLTPKGYRPEGY